METMWIEILAVHIEDADEREGCEKFGKNFWRGEIRRVDKDRGCEFIAMGAAREAGDRSTSPDLPRPSVRLKINDVTITTAARHG